MTHTDHDLYPFTRNTSGRAISGYAISLAIARNALAVAAVVAIGLGACKSSATKSNDDNASGLIKAADRIPLNEPIKREPIPGVDTSGLDEKKTERFYKHAVQLPSPCGKAHSLRTSVETDSECKRAIFAIRYVASLIEDGADDADIKNHYGYAYNDKPRAQIALSPDTLRVGPDDAPVKIVEYYDYGCPACKLFWPLIKEVGDEYNGKVAVYYMQYPLLQAHPQSLGAAQATLAAAKQGKFSEMHDRLFENSHDHSKDDLFSYAKEIGLDMNQFEGDFAAAVEVVKANIASGDSVGVGGTPTIFINGRQYQGPTMPKYFKMWIEEEIALNR